MSNYTVVAEYPAFKVLAGNEKDFYAPGETFMIGLTRYRLGDVFSYALENGKCPMRAKEDAEARCHEIYFAFTTGAVISAAKHKQEVTFAQNIGDVIKYAGKRFTIVAAPNNNVTLVEVK
jgi:hypothetical protein